MGAAVGVVVIALIWCIKNTWDREEEEQDSGREWLLSRLKCPNLRRSPKSDHIA
jgi:hypothetical protein